MKTIIYLIGLAQSNIRHRSLSSFILFALSRNARHSIRWLERELSRGHKGIQAQELNHKVKVNMTPPNRKSPEWSKFNILQCIAFQVFLSLVLILCSYFYYVIVQFKSIFS